MSNTIPDSNRAVDFMVTKAKGLEYKPVETLEEARNTPNAIVVLDGDYGGQVYATCQVKHLIPTITHAQLEAICKQLSALEWDQEDDWQVSYQIKAPGEGVWGGMGGGRVLDGLWMHPKLCQESIKLLQPVVSAKC